MLEHARDNRGVKAAAVAGATAVTIGATYLGLVSFQLPAWAIEMTRLWGPGFLMILLVFAAVAYYVPRNVVRDMAGAHKQQAAALTSLAASVKALPTKDDLKIESLLIGQDLCSQGLEKIDRRLDRIEERLDKEAQQ